VNGNSEAMTVFHRDHPSRPSRRGFLALAAVPGSLAWRDLHAQTSAAAGTPVRGGTLVIGVGREPPLLTSALTTAGPTQTVSGKIFDGLLTYDTAFKPQPQLATSWKSSADGLSITLNLRPDVRWHDGKPFTSADVAFSVLEAWKKYNARGRSTFLNVEQVDTPSPLVAVLRLARPAPFILQALASTESQVIPKHLYAGTDVMANPHNSAPVGTGPFRFVRWEKGRQLVLERNPDYWDKASGRPYLDQIVFRQVTDPGAAVAALETGSVHLSAELPLSDIKNLANRANLAVHRRNNNANLGITGIEFNLERPLFQDLRVRQAVAHSIEREFLLKNVWFGYGTVEHGPIPSGFQDFYTADVPRYPFDLKKAEALLEAAGHKRNAQGIRLQFTCDPNATGNTLSQTAQVLRSNLARIGVKLDVRSQDFGEFINRVYTRRDFDTSIVGASAGPDPAIGTQRFYWSKNIQPGVAFSNGAAYRNPEVDRLLEAAQVENDPVKRRALYVRFQQIVQTDLPKIPLISAESVVVASRQLRDFLSTSEGTLGNFAGAWLARSNA